MLKYTFSKVSLGEFKEKSSIFYSVAQTVSSINDLKSKLSNVKGKYPDASHVCYAYRIKMGDRLDEFYSDAGEPKGSAGKPILNTLKRNNLINSVIFVIRYFGGTKLGIPGLIHAYGSAAQEVIGNAIIKQCLEKKRIGISYPYKLEGIIKSLLEKEQIEVIHEDFGEKIDIQLDIDVKSANEFIDSIKELSARFGQIILTE